MKEIEKARAYTKKPVTITAIKWTGENLKDVIDFTGLNESANKWSWEEYCAKLIQQYAESYHAKKCAKCKDMLLDDMRHSRGDYSRFEKRSGITTDVGVDE